MLGSLACGGERRVRELGTVGVAFDAVGVEKKLEEVPKREDKSRRDARTPCDPLRRDLVEIG